MNLKLFRVIFCGIARDNALEIPGVLRSIEATGSLFDAYTAVVFENDSVDQTRELLLAWRDRTARDIRIISETHNNQKRPSLGFLAYCRNKYLHEINKPDYDSFTHVIMVDFDMGYGWPPAGVIHSFQQNDWDVMAANGISTRMGHMWDAFSFRTAELNEPYRSDKYGPIENYWPVINTPAYQRIYPVGSPLVPVYSAFGGLCIYRKEILRGLSYDESSEDCEHVSLHKAIREKGGRIFMNPRMMLMYNHFR
jgi:hypothetical protein